MWFLWSVILVIYDGGSLRVCTSDLRWWFEVRYQWSMMVVWSSVPVIYDGGLKFGTSDLRWWFEVRYQWSTMVVWSSVPVIYDGCLKFGTSDLWWWFEVRYQWSTMVVVWGLVPVIYDGGSFRMRFQEFKTLITLRFYTNDIHVMMATLKCCQWSSKAIKYTYVTSSILVKSWY